MKPAACVIGAGLSGLVAASHLIDRGFSVTISDRQPRAGGLLSTIETPHGLVETAANAFVWDDAVAGWFKRLDLAPVFPLASSSRRYIFRDGRPRRWPLSIAESIGMTARLGGAAVTRSMSARRGESMARWGDRVIGAPAREWLLEPAMQGIYAAPAAELSAAAIFGGRKRGRRRLAAPRRGMGQFIERLAQQLRERGACFELGRDIDRVDAAAPTVIATDAASAARLVMPHAPRLSERLAAVRLAPLVTATMFFTPEPTDVQGFGVLFPRQSGVRALGALFNSDIFEGRSGGRSETWIVGDRDEGLTTRNDGELRRMLAEDRRRLTGRDDEPLSAHITRWPAAIPVYDHALLAVQDELASLPPWLALSGNYLGRIGVAALLDIACGAARRVAS
jgi:oxygen-dependent protoporphyrinogen oxidase